MLHLTNEEISELYALLSHYHNNYLAKAGVQLPSLYRNGVYTKDALTLVYLAYDYPNTRIVTRDELVEFLRQYDPSVLEVPQPRQLSTRKGWYILAGSRNKSDSALQPGEYRLKTLEKPAPGFSAQPCVSSLTDTAWEAVKAQYDYRCACCGCKEGEPHRYQKSHIVQLHKGKMDPAKPLTVDNTIPQCGVCYRPFRNFWVYNKKGRILAVANAKAIDASSEVVQREIYTRLYAKYNGADPDTLE
jgi:hypothetical protein